MHKWQLFRADPKESLPSAENIKRPGVFTLHHRRVVLSFLYERQSVNSQCRWRHHPVRLFLCLLKAYSPANRTGSPQGFTPSVQITTVCSKTPTDDVVYDDVKLFNSATPKGQYCSPCGNSSKKRKRPEGRNTFFDITKDVGQSLTIRRLLMLAGTSSLQYKKCC